MEHMMQPTERTKVLDRLTHIAHKALHIQDEAHAHPVNWDDEKVAHEVGHLRRMIEALHDEARTYVMGDHPSDSPPSESSHDGKTRLKRPPRVHGNARRPIHFLRPGGTHTWWWWVSPGALHVEIWDNMGNKHRIDARKVAGHTEARPDDWIEANWDGCHWTAITPSLVKRYIEDHLV